MRPIYSVTTRDQETTLPQLAIRCDDREIPNPLQGTAVEHCIGFAEVAGIADVLDAGQRFCVIVAPQSDRLPSYWFAIDLPEVSISSSCQVGLFKKRPAGIVVTADQLAVRFLEPSRLYTNGRAQGRQSQKMLETLQRHAATVDGRRQAAAKNAPPVTLVAFRSLIVGSLMVAFVLRKASSLGDAASRYEVVSAVMADGYVLIEIGDSDTSSSDQLGQATMAISALCGQR